ncbi:MAG: zinc ABC transporter substrate-binding protein [Firmicutes bacterium]|nr:zinc ABC transporter substrate-binding protein [Bacillota bacterium]
MRRAIFALILVGCVFLASPASGQAIRVVTTFPILEDFVEQVGGEQVQVSSLIPRGADPHTWEPTPKDARLVAQGDLIVANGGGFDDWLFALVQNVARPDTPLVIASQGLEVIVPEYDHGHSHHHAGDPHFWLSVPNAISYVEQITEALVGLAPEKAVYFESRARVYSEELVELHAWMTQELSGIPRENRVIVTYHNAFSYLAEEYGFEVAEFLVANPDAEPSPRDLARLVDLLQGMRNRSVFAEPQLASGTRYLQALVDEVHGDLFILYSDSLNEEISTYVEMMKCNTRTLLEALK